MTSKPDPKSPIGLVPAAQPEPTTQTDTTPVLVETLSPKKPQPALQQAAAQATTQTGSAQLPIETAEIVAQASEPQSGSNTANVKSSPLLSSTPPTVSKTLIKSYPFLMLSHKVLSILTWTDDNINIPLFLVVFSTIAILYYDVLIVYAGHLLPVLILWVYSEAYAYVSQEQFKDATLDIIVQTMSQVSQKTEILISPIVSLNLTAGDLKRLLFTTIFLSPAYIVISLFILTPQKILLIFVFSILTYHSKWSKITRELLWKSRSIRLLCFYITGLDFENQYTERPSLFHLNKKLTSKIPKFNGSNTVNGSSIDDNKKNVRFTYAMYENQRRWLGVGWTPNLLSYERTPWTDEFLNEAPPLENFELPKLTNESAGMIWRWVDKTWRLDRTNDSSIQINSGKAKTTANPKNDEGWIYFDNTWKSPGLEDSFSKYTRRRRWVRTAELVKIGGSQPAAQQTTPAPAATVVVVDEPTESKVKFGSDTVSGDNDAVSEHSAADHESLIQSNNEEGQSDSEGKTKRRRSIRFED